MSACPWSLLQNIPLTITVLLWKFQKTICGSTPKHSEVYPSFQSKCYRLHHQLVTDGAHPWTTAVMPQKTHHLGILQGFRARPAHRASKQHRYGGQATHDPQNLKAYETESEGSEQQSHKWNPGSIHSWTVSYRSILHRNCPVNERTVDKLLLTRD